MHTLAEAYAMSNTELREALDAARNALKIAESALRACAWTIGATDKERAQAANGAADRAGRAAIRAQDVLNG